LQGKENGRHHKGEIPRHWRPISNLRRVKSQSQSRPQPTFPRNKTRQSTQKPAPEHRVRKTPRSNLTGRSTEHDHDSLDIQDLIFGHNSPPSSAVLERAALDQESQTPTQDALDQAISEVREIGDPLDAPSGDASDDEKTEDDKSEDEAEVPTWQKGYTCMYAHDGTESANNPNSKTIEVLSKMQAYYERTNDQWRALSYRKAISTLKKTKIFVATETQARAYVLPRKKLTGQNSWNWRTTCQEDCRDWYVTPCGGD
jgi:Helix-hairpin-helix domain